MKKRTLNVVPAPPPVEEYVPPTEMYPRTPSTEGHTCYRCDGPLLAGSPLFFLRTDKRVYHVHRYCPAEADDE